MSAPAGHRAPGAQLRRAQRAMGTVISVHVHDDAPDAGIEAAVDALFAEVERLEQIFSTFRPDSVVSRINRGELKMDVANFELLKARAAQNDTQAAIEGRVS